jgi:2-succinyl-5-enolpyruvyl-6-hydroxy-3-cyclohexene-1-carboxylate synthase
VNEILIETRHQGCGPVHINVPITEPLFDYTVKSLPRERKIKLVSAEVTPPTLSHIGRMFMLAERPMLICGQPLNSGFDEAVALVENDENYVPDFVLYIGGSIVSKRLKRFLRKAREVWTVNASG